MVFNSNAFSSFSKYKNYLVQNTTSYSFIIKKPETKVSGFFVGALL